MKTYYIGAYEVPDGYFGEKAIIHLVFDEQTTCCYEVSQEGYFRSQIPPALTVDEVTWLLNNRPQEKRRYKRII